MTNARKLHLVLEVKLLFFWTPSIRVREVLCKVLSQSWTQWAAVRNMLLPICENNLLKVALDQYVAV